MRVNSKIFIIIILALLLLSSKLYANKAYTLNALVEKALKNNPEVGSAHSNWLAAEHKSGYVAGLPDPQARYSYLFENVETRVGPQEHKYGLSQTIPFPGKLSTKAKAQLKRSEELMQKYQAARRAKKEAEKAKKKAKEKIKNFEMR
jgi:hypothetical protein